MTSPIIFRESSNLNFLRSSIESEVRRVTKPTWTSLIRDTLNAGVPFTSRNWLERNLQPVGKSLGIRTPLTFQVLRRSFATHNQRQLKNVQAHLGHESTGSTADLYVVEVPDEVRRTQELYAGEIEALVKPNESLKAGKKHPSPGGLAGKLDATGRKSSKDMSVSYCFMVSAAGFEPATHALKGQHGTSPPIFFYNIHAARSEYKTPIRR